MVEQCASRATRPSPKSTLRRGLGLQPGAVLRDPAGHRSRRHPVDYANLGFQNATVESDPGLARRWHARRRRVPGPRRPADLRRSRPDRRQRADAHGDHRARAAGQARRAAQPQDAVIESQRRLTRARAVPPHAHHASCAHGDETARDLLVTVEEAPATTVGYGGGFEVGPRIQETDGVGGRASSSSRRGRSSRSAAAICSARTAP